MDQQERCLQLQTAQRPQLQTARRPQLRTAQRLYLPAREFPRLRQPDRHHILPGVFFRKMYQKSLIIQFIEDVLSCKHNTSISIYNTYHIFFVQLVQEATYLQKIYYRSQSRSD